MKKFVFHFVFLALGVLISDSVLADNQTYCVFNMTDAAMEEGSANGAASVLWEKSCVESKSTINTKSRMMYTCPDPVKAILKVVWGDLTKYYKFPGVMYEKQCTDANSLTIKGKDQVFKGKGF